MTLDHHDETTARAMRVVARGLIADAVSAFVTGGPRILPGLEGLDEYACYDVSNIAMELTQPPSDEDFAAAMEHLTKRGQR